jgi:DNA-binding NarL/FixJ family response regulator
MKAIKIILADDHRLLREALHLFISSDRRFKVIGECDNGEEAVRLCRELHPDLLILDINLPLLNGMDAAGLIKTASPLTKILAVSLHTELFYVNKMFRMGASGYVSKSSAREEIMDAIETILHGGKYICKEVRDIFCWPDAATSNTPAGLHSLTPRELEIITLVSKGNSSTEIAGLLNIAPRTVEVHRHNVLKKLKLKNTAALLKMLYPNGSS